MRGVDPCMSSKLKPVLEEFGLTDIKHDHRNLPLGWGPEEIGPPFKKVRSGLAIIWHGQEVSSAYLFSIFQQNVMSTIRSCKPQMSVVLGETEENLEETISAAEQEMGEEYQSYMTFDSYIVRKLDISTME